MLVPELNLIQLYSGVSFEGYSLNTSAGRNVINAPAGKVLELSVAEMTEIASVSVENCKSLQEELHLARREFIIKEQVWKLAASSHAFVVKTENSIHDADTCLLQIYIALQAYLLKNPHKTAKYTMFLEEIIKCATLGKSIKPGNLLFPRDFVTRMFVKFTCTSEEDTMRKYVRELYRKIILNQEAFCEYLMDGEEMTSIIENSHQKCAVLSQNLQVQIDTLERARSEMCRAQKHVGLCSIKLGIIEKLQKNIGQTTPASIISIESARKEDIPAVQVI